MVARGLRGDRRPRGRPLAAARGADPRAERHVLLLIIVITSIITYYRLCC